MASSVALNEAQAHLGALLDRVEQGEEIVIEREGHPGVKLVPLASYATPSVSRRIGGQNIIGIAYIAPDFDAPMTDEDLKEWGY
ncbi:hypothetical protein BH10ACI4_BH10ACI4_09910 [soil metagenome]